jgi:uncharacterized caspase-like protein
VAKYAIIIGVEKYQDSSISQVVFAEADANDFSVTLVQHGFALVNQVILTSAQATKNVIESKLRLLLRRLKDDDVLYFFYAGHGFSKNGANYITCHDCQRGDLANSSIALQTIFSQLKSSKCNRVVMFLDACESGMTATADMRGIYSVLTREELEDFFRSAEYHICFAACKEDEYSYPSNKLGHGVWTYHVLQALGGHAPLALEANNIVSPRSLQNYLSKEVPTWLALNRTDGAIQTPWFYGTQSRDFMIADVGPVLAKRKLTKTQDRVLKRAVLSRTIYGERVRSLSGYRKQDHSIPIRINDSTNRFLADIAESEITQDVNELHGLLREQFKYLRKELSSGVEGTSGNIIAPDFEYTVNVSLDPDDLSKLIWKRELSNLRDSDTLNRKEFDEVFRDMFDTVELEFNKRINLEEFIDTLEAAGIRPDYDSACTECMIRLPNIPGTIRVTDLHIELVQPRVAASPKTLIADFKKARLLLVQTDSASLLG